MSKVVITGMSAICAAGEQPAVIWEAVRSGRSALGPIRQWNASSPPGVCAGEIPDFDPRRLVGDRKLHKVLRRTDLLGLYAAGRAVEEAGLPAYRAALAPAEATALNDRTGVFVGSGGSAYQTQYDFFPLLAAAAGDLQAFGRELTATVNPMWLLRTLPNNVLCHIGIRYGFKGPNACVANHSVSGLQAVAEAVAALRAGEADRAIAVGHDAPVEPETVRYYQQLGLLAADSVRPFDAQRTGSVLGEGAAALMLESDAAAQARGTVAIGEILGSGCTSEAGGLLALRADGDGLARAVELALDDAGLDAHDIGMIVAHGNGTRLSDASEATALQRVFGSSVPPVTAFKWAFGHLLAASGVIETVLALVALQHRMVPGIATLREVDPDCAGLPLSSAPQVPRSDIALVLSRGFAGTSTALLVRGAHPMEDQ